MKTVNPSTPLRVNGESFDVVQDAAKDTEPVEARNRTIKFFTVGCKVNQYETQELRERFINAGFKEIDNGEKSDLYIINTCTVTHRADADSLNFIRRVKKENSQARVVVTGCLAELDEDRIKEINGISLIVKNRDKGKIIDLFNQNYRTKEQKNRGTKTGISYFKGHTRAFLKIQDGCSNFCSYCRVPLARGKSKSRDLSEIVNEAKDLVRNGFKEIVLCGICLGAYGKDIQPKKNLVDAVEALQNLDGLLRIRLSSIEAGDISDELIDKMSESNPNRRTRKLCQHLHIPIQSGDDEILKKMSRDYCRQDYLNLIKKIKSRIPDIAITTDVIVGFVGEGEINFKNTIDLIKKISPLKVHIFPYSPRQGTPSYHFKDKVSPAKIRERIFRLQEIARACGLSYKKQFLNKNMDVLIEGRSKENKGYWQGYTDNYLRVLVKSNLNLKNRLIRVRLKKIVKDSVLA